MNKKNINIILSLLLVIILSFSCSGIGGLANVNAKSTYELSNPVTDKDGISTWDTIYFGNYYQSNGKTKEPIQWRILSINEEDAFLLSDKNLDIREFHDELAHVQWEDCELRSWLNTDFINLAFSQKEQNAIKTTRVINNEPSPYHLTGGDPTEDKVYLLSAEEASNPAYGFHEDINARTETRVAKSTNYEKRKQINSPALDEDTWWLRSPGKYTDEASVIYATGAALSNKVNYKNYPGWTGPATHPGWAVRPVIHLDLSDTSLWSKGEQVKAEGGTYREKQQDQEEDDQTFQLGRDNNSYEHVNYAPWGGFMDIKTNILSENVLKHLKKYANKGEISNIKKESQEKWGGSCYGIASTIALTYEGKLSLKDLSKRGNAECYYDLEYPYENEKLMDQIQFYHFSNSVEAISKYNFIEASYTKEDPGDFGISNWIKEKRGLKSTQKEFLQKLVNFASNHKVGLLGYSHIIKKRNQFGIEGKETSGHTIVILGCTYDKGSGEYLVKLYDENSVNHPEGRRDGEFKYMRIAKDYSKFTFDGIDQKEDYSLSFLPAPDLSRIDKKTQSSVNHTVSIVIPSDALFRLENQNGNYIQQTSDGITGNMEIYDVKIHEQALDVDEFIYIPPAPTVTLEVDASSQFIFIPKEEKSEISIYDQDNYMSLSGESVKKVTFDLDSNLKVEGNDYSFDATLSTDEIAENENGLVSVAGHTKSELKIYKDENTVTASSENLISDIKTATYTGAEKKENKVYNDVKTIRVDDQEHTQEPADNPSNPDTPDIVIDPIVKSVITNKTIYLKNNTCQYTGKIIKPTVYVRNTDGDLLDAGIDYKISYRKNKDVGKADIIITGIGDYKGTFIKSFTIQPKGTSIKSVKSAKKALSIKWNKQTLKMSKNRISGYQLQYATNKSFSKAKTISIKGYALASKKLAKLISKKTYYVRIRTYMKAGGKNYYSNWSKAKTGKVK